jgi:hypothetical protein
MTTRVITRGGLLLLGRDDGQLQSRPLCGIG